MARLTARTLSSRQHPPVSIPLPHAVSSASLHPVKRDRFVVGSSADPWVRVYDLDTGKEQEVYKGHHGPVHCVSYSPDGEVYGSGSEDGESAILNDGPSRTIRQWAHRGARNVGRNDSSLADESRDDVWTLAIALWPATTGRRGRQRERYRRHIPVMCPTPDASALLAGPHTRLLLRIVVYPVIASPSSNNGTLSFPEPEHTRQAA